MPIYPKLLTVLLITINKLYKVLIGHKSHLVPHKIPFFSINNYQNKKNNTYNASYQLNIKPEEFPIKQ